MSKVKIVLEYDTVEQSIYMDDINILYWSFSEGDLERLKLDTILKQEEILPQKEESLDKLTKLRSMGLSVDESAISNNTQLLDDLLQNAQLSVWQSYCDKKMECEDLRDMLSETLSMLEYSHTTSEVYYDHKKVSDFIKNTKDYLKENKC